VLSVGATPDSSGIDAGGRWGCLWAAAGSAPAAGRARRSDLARCSGAPVNSKFKNQITHTVARAPSRSPRTRGAHAAPSHEAPCEDAPLRRTHVNAKAGSRAGAASNCIAMHSGAT